MRASIPQVQDPGLRYVLEITRRSIIAVATAIAAVTQDEPEPPRPLRQE